MTDRRCWQIVRQSEQGIQKRPYPEVRRKSEHQSNQLFFNGEQCRLRTFLPFHFASTLIGADSPSAWIYTHFLSNIDHFTG